MTSTEQKWVLQDIHAVSKTGMESGMTAMLETLKEATYQLYQNALAAGQGEVAQGVLRAFTLMSAADHVGILTRAYQTHSLYPNRARFWESLPVRTLPSTPTEQDSTPTEQDSTPTE